jgi:hypothetical protein
MAKDRNPRRLVAQPMPRRSYTDFISEEKIPQGDEHARKGEKREDSTEDIPMRSICRNGGCSIQCCICVNQVKASANLEVVSQNEEYSTGDST